MGGRALLSGGVSLDRFRPPDEPEQPVAIDVAPARCYYCDEAIPWGERCVEFGGDIFCSRECRDGYVEDETRSVVAGA